MERTLSLSDVKARLSAIVDEIEKGHEIVITRMGRPVAKVVPYRPAAAASRLGFAAGQIRVADDFEEWSDEEARSLRIVD
ncbi:MAG TPA: type II toxin-antitoxin system prevent-host-death family antitoxin [Gammaproteobacteria bacterium]|nr:type II toxin-antitoxin system prevent-host-death family antitoxin [Gammaproteobacteria bacterium]